MIITDLHTHSNFSADGHHSVDEMCLKAIDKGMQYLCLTEHFDASLNDPDRLFYNYEAVSSAISSARLKFKNSLSVLKGIEFSEAHLYSDKLAQLNKLDFDMIIGSIHAIDDIFISEPALTNKYSYSELYNLYFKEVLKSVQAGGFDVLGHLDFPCRYYPQYYTAPDILEQIFKECISQSIVPEINTSTLRKGFNFTMPDDTALAIYSDCGGKYISCGSDGHRTEDIAADFDYLESKIVKFNFIPIVFINREMREATLI